MMSGYVDDECLACGHRDPLGLDIRICRSCRMATCVDCLAWDGRCESCRREDDPVDDDEAEEAP